MSNELLLQKLESLPVSPGCYLFKDKAGAVLYVGKAKSLRSRVRSYFQESSSDVRAFIPFGATCPGLTEPHRDRQGMGVACIDLVG